MSHIDEAVKMPGSGFMGSNIILRYKICDFGFCYKIQWFVWKCWCAWMSDFGVASYDFINLFGLNCDEQKKLLIIY